MGQPGSGLSRELAPDALNVALKGFIGKWRKILFIVEASVLLTGLVLLYHYSTTKDPGMLVAGVIVLGLLPFDALILYYYLRSMESILKTVMGGLIRRFKPRSFRARAGFLGVVLSMDLEDRWLVVNYSGKKVENLCIRNPSVEHVYPTARIRLSLRPKAAGRLLAGLSCRTVRWEGRSRYRVLHPVIEGVAEVSGYSYYAQVVCPSHVSERVISSIVDKMNCQESKSFTNGKALF